MVYRLSRLDIRHLRYALAVADAGGFRAASEILNVAQPAISKAVRDTEEDLGFKIFERNTKSISITENGRIFLDDARQTVAQFERTIRSSQQSESGKMGHIIIGYSALANSNELTKGIEEFQAVYPNVQIEMHIMSTDSMMRNLKKGSIDIGFQLEHETVRDKAIKQKTIWQSAVGIVEPLEANSALEIDLNTTPLVLGVRDNWRPYRLFLDAAFKEHQIHPNVIDEAWDIHVIFQRVLNGRGLTLLPVGIEPSLPRSLKVRTINSFNATVDINMAWSHAADTALLRLFRSYYIDRFNIA